MLKSQPAPSSASASPDYLHCSHEIVCGLIDTASSALCVHFPKAVGDTLDVELVLDALRVFRPSVAEIGMLDGVLHIVHGRWSDAAHALTAVIDLAPDFVYAKAMMAYCLASKGEPGWRQWAHSALESKPNREALELVCALEAREDLNKAVHDYRGGEFRIPESCQLPAGSTQADPARQDEDRAARPVSDPQLNYLRA
ncbi:HrpB1 family type III secretion system apparatus protein [Burkholderia cepacia]|uniref:HrpB1 family type III secretion system apparatus protein n=1 Tax=Burkholderia cepacia TaxID=292 RepID=UPI00158DC097|nr:HrpB1 family type III secretion system apparatus protein [Burkholderia cepacia]